MAEDMEKDITIGELGRLIGRLEDSNNRRFDALESTLSTLVSREAFEAEKQRVNEKFDVVGKNLETEIATRQRDKTFVRWAITTVVALLAILASSVTKLLLG